jgi:hypothetical protein
MPKCALCGEEAAEVCLPKTLAADPAVCTHKTEPRNPWGSPLPLPDYVPPVDDPTGRAWGSPPEPGPAELAHWAKAHEPLDLSHEEARTYFYPDPGEGFIQVDYRTEV